MYTITRGDNVCLGFNEIHFEDINATWMSMLAAGAGNPLMDLLVSGNAAYFANAPEV